MIEAGEDLIGNPRVTQLRDAPSPTSRGSTTLSSASANDPPIIDPNNSSTHGDCTASCYSARRIMQASLESSAGNALW